MSTFSGNESANKMQIKFCANKMQLQNFQKIDK